MALCWNAYCGDFNSGEIRTVNIFDHYGFFHDCVKAAKKFKDDKDGFADSVRGSLMYYFWAKCEWEIILGHWPDGEIGDMRTTAKAGELYDALQSAGIKYDVGRIEHMRDREVVMKVFPKMSRFRERKIDVYEQVRNNWDIFIDYLWEHRKELKEKKHGE